MKYQWETVYYLPSNRTNNMGGYPSGGHTFRHVYPMEGRGLEGAKLRFPYILEAVQALVDRGAEDITISLNVQRSQEYDHLTVPELESLLEMEGDSHSTP